MGFPSLTLVNAYPDTKSVILPKLKPKEISKSANKVKTRNILPIRKPALENLKITKTREILPKNKPIIESKIKEREIVEMKEQLK